MSSNFHEDTDFRLSSRNSKGWATLGSDSHIPLWWDKQGPGLPQPSPGLSPSLILLAWPLQAFAFVLVLSKDNYGGKAFGPPGSTSSQQKATPKPHCGAFSSLSSSLRLLFSLTPLPQKTFLQLLSLVFTFLDSGHHLPKIDTWIYWIDYLQQGFSKDKTPSFLKSKTTKDSTWHLLFPDQHAFSPLLVTAPQFPLVESQCSPTLGPCGLGGAESISISRDRPVTWLEAFRAGHNDWEKSIPCPLGQKLRMMDHWGSPCGYGLSKHGTPGSSTACSQHYFWTLGHSWAN